DASRVNSSSEHFPSRNPTTMSANSVEGDRHSNTSTSHKVASQAAKHAPLPLPTKKEDVDVFKAVDALSAKPQASNVSDVPADENLLPVEAKKNNHSILLKRYQAMLDNPNLSSRFNADPKTRAAIARMQ